MRFDCLNWEQVHAKTNSLHRFLAVSWLPKVSNKYAKHKDPSSPFDLFSVSCHSPLTEKTSGLSDRIFPEEALGPHTSDPRSPFLDHVLQGVLDRKAYYIPHTRLWNFSSNLRIQWAWPFCNESCTLRENLRGLVPSSILRPTSSGSSGFLPSSTQWSQEGIPEPKHLC